MGLRDRLRKLKREAEDGAVVVRLRDGTARYFEDMDVFAEMFLAEMDLLKGVSRDSEVLDAVRNATPESREAFEREYGPIEREVRIIAPPADGGWVEVYRLSEDGAVGKVRHEGGSPEAERMRREALQGQAPTDTPSCQALLGFRGSEACLQHAWRRLTAPRTGTEGRGRGKIPPWKRVRDRRVDAG